VADQQQGALVVGEQVLEQVEGVHVEVVGRLDEHQQVGRAGQRAGQQQAVPLAAREAGDRLAELLLGEQELLGVAGDVAGLAADHDLVAAAGG